MSLQISQKYSFFVFKIISKIIKEGLQVKYQREKTKMLSNKIPKGEIQLKFQTKTRPKTSQAEV